MTACVKEVTRLSAALHIANSRVSREVDCRALSAIIRAAALFIPLPKYVNMIHKPYFHSPRFLYLQTIVRHDLVQQLEGLSRDLLMQEGALVKQKFTWVDDLRCRGTLHNAAMRILVRKEIEKLIVDDDDLVGEVVGTKREEGIVLTLLQHFEVCLPTLVRSPLNPQVPEFIPDEKQWELSKEAKRDPDGACLFPIYLKDDLIVCHKWGEDKQDDLNVHVYFLPEIPHGFFHRYSLEHVLSFDIVYFMVYHYNYS